MYHNGLCSASWSSLKLPEAVGTEDEMVAGCEQTCQEDEWRW